MGFYKSTIRCENVRESMFYHREIFHYHSQKKEEKKIEIFQFFQRCARIKFHAQAFLVVKDFSCEFNERKLSARLK